MDFYFKPMAGSFTDGILRVQPDILPKGSVRIADVWIDGVPYADFDADAMTVKLPTGRASVKVRVRLEPTSVRFSVDVTEVKNGVATFVLNGDLTPLDLKYLDSAIVKALQQNAKAIEIDARELNSICTEALRFMLFRKQKAGPDFKVTVKHASEAVRKAMHDAAIDEEIVVERDAVPA